MASASGKVMTMPQIICMAAMAIGGRPTMRFE